MELEIWKEIEGFDGRYSISSLGRVRAEECTDSIGHLHRQYIRKASLGTTGYYSVMLHLNGFKRRFSIHRLVASAFIPNPNNYNVINHKDENKTNNKVDNLEWCTQKYNYDYSYVPEEHYVPILQLSMSGELIKEWRSITSITKEFGKRLNHISSCCRGKLYSVAGYIWRYKNEGYFERPNNTAGPKGHQFKKPVVQMDKSGNVIKRYGSSTDAEKETGVNTSKISMCCHGKRNTAGGFVWKFDAQQQYNNTREQ